MRAATPPSNSTSKLNLLFLLLLAGCGGDSRPGGATVGLIAPEGARGDATVQGAELGAEEAVRAGALIGRSLRLEVARAGSAAEARRAAERLLDDGAFAIAGGFDDATCRALAEVAERREAIYLNLGCTAPALRSPERRHTLHVAATDSMHRGVGPGAVLWHPSLARFGAAQLNERFRRRYGAAADADGWAGWMGVKVLWEGVVRTGGTDAPALLAFYEGPDAAFDGHKGEPLRFDWRTHQLAQPLYPAAASRARRGEDAGGVEIPVASGPLPGGPLLFVSNEGSGDVTAIDLVTYQPVARIPVGSRPRGIHVAPDGGSLLVALSDLAPTAASDADAIAVVDLDRGTVSARHAAGSDPEQFVLSRDGTVLYAANEDAGTATISELDTGREIATLVVGVEPEGVAVSPDGRWVYVTAETSNTVSVIDTRTHAVVASFLVDVRPRAAAFAPKAPRAYVSNEISGTLTVVDTRTHRVLGKVGLGSRAKPVGVVVSPDGSRVYVANGHGNSVAVIDAESSRLVATVPVGRRPWGIAVSDDGARIFTANGGSNDVSVIDAATLRVVRTIPAGDRPWGVAVGRAR